MIIGIMQPYLFPYLGYYQLAYHCDKFVFYDDVNYIKSGYINRNYILSNGKKQLVTLAVQQASSFKKINELFFISDTKKILRTIEQTYSKSPFLAEVMLLITQILNAKNRNLAYITCNSIKIIFEYLGIKKDFYLSSKLEYDRSLSAEKKLYAICNFFNANQYCNALGGQSLYSKADFKKNNIDLSFIKMNDVLYPQGKNDFVSHLSIIDILMWNSKSEVKTLLKQYKLI